MKGKVYTISEILNISKSHGGSMKDFIIDCYEKNLINVYHTWDEIDYWIETGHGTLDAVLEYPEIYTIRIELKENK